jgi:myo-inositol-1(or 4)-monophosphatase
MQPTLNQIKTWALEAGKILKGGFGHEHQIGHKGTIDLVTEMDQHSEDYLLGEIRKLFPGHTLISEESGKHSGDVDNCWYVDPLDGTMNYAHGIPIFTVSIGYSHAGSMQLGVIYDPMQDELFSAERGKGAFRNDQRIHVSHHSELIDSLLVTGFPYDIHTNENNNLDHFGYFSRRSQGVRRLGSAALDMCYVAAGRFDGYWELGIKPWDIAAGILMVEEAGGVVTDLDGGSNYFNPPYAILTATPGLHGKLLDHLISSRKGKK